VARALNDAADAVADVRWMKRRRETEFGWSDIGFTEVGDKTVSRIIAELSLKDQP
jgi:hypothetical protein